MRMFTPRNPKSPWSRINKNKVARLLEQGRMTAAGMRLVKAAKADGSWNVSDEIEDLVIPPDLASALAENDAAEDYFEKLPDSSEEERPLVDKVGAQVRDAGCTNREDCQAGRREPAGLTSLRDVTNVLHEASAKGTVSALALWVGRKPVVSCEVHSPEKIVV